MIVALKETINNVPLVFNSDAHLDRLDHQELGENLEWMVPMEDQESQDLTVLMFHSIQNQHSHVSFAQLGPQELVDHKEKLVAQVNLESLDIQVYQVDQENQEELETLDFKEKLENKESQESKDHQEMIQLEELELRVLQDHPAQEDQKGHQDPTVFHHKTVDHQDHLERWVHQGHQVQEESPDHQGHSDHQEILENQEVTAHLHAEFKKLLLHQFPSWILMMSLRSHLVEVIPVVVMEKSKFPRF